MGKEPVAVGGKRKHCRLCLLLAIFLIVTAIAAAILLWLAI
jgi:hypothetical protein